MNLAVRDQKSEVEFPRGAAVAGIGDPGLGKRGITKFTVAGTTGAGYRCASCAGWHGFSRSVATWKEKTSNAQWNNLRLAPLRWVVRRWALDVRRSAFSAASMLQRFAGPS